MDLIIEKKLNNGKKADLTLNILGMLLEERLSVGQIDEILQSIRDEMSKLPLTGQ